MKYFDNCKTIEDVKKTYHKLVKALHPDNGGDPESFKEMQAEYMKVFEALKNVFTNKDGETYTKTSKETPEEYADIINRVIHFDGVKVEIIGSWVWLTGNTLMYREEIKAAGFFWSKSKKAWYYTGEKEYRKRKGHYSMNKLRSKWGSEEIEPEQQQKIS